MYLGSPSPVLTHSDQRNAFVCNHQFVNIHLPPLVTDTYWFNIEAQQLYPPKSYYVHQ